ncbi:MAG: hypothetical protein KO206_09545 [Methanomicrobiaceae archaeon]|nr:hypothetical protein [Methanomicrobiaceae archaeon]MDD5419191.1 spore germination protein GerW family protein [Methanomicrobiaceae archaeon]
MFRMTVDELSKLLCAGCIVGTPIESADKIIIPVADFAFGFGSGEGNMEKSGGGAGTGAGGSVSAVALLIVYRDIPGPGGIQFISLKKKGPFAEVVSTIGEMFHPEVEKAVEKGSEMIEKKQHEGEMGTGA